MKHKFGWDLPPGVTNRMIEEQAGAFEEEEMRENLREDKEWSDISMEAGELAEEWLIHGDGLELTTKEWDLANRTFECWNRVSYFIAQALEYGTQYDELRKQAIERS